MNPGKRSFNPGCLPGRRRPTVSRRAGKVSDLRRIQEQAARFPEDDSEAVGHVGYQLQRPVGGRGTHTHTHGRTHTHTHIHEHHKLVFLHK